MDFDVVIVGSGLAGLSTALSLGEGLRVAVIAKRALQTGASDWAQGGIAAVLDSADSIDQHVQDTLIAGAYLCDESAVRSIVENGRAAIDWLIGQGAVFTPDPQAELGYHLTREGGHAQRRIIHAADATGHAVLSALAEKARLHPGITLLEHHQAADLLTEGTRGHSDYRCVGVRVLDLASGRPLVLNTPHVVLACGGAGRVFLHTSNPDTATGDGMAMAWRAGCRLANMEFIQFHPTFLHHSQARSFLISEALRGEGAVLRDASGVRFMPGYDTRAELAPRDVVARAIHNEMTRQNTDCVYLDITHRSADFIQAHFPTIAARCASLGIDMTRDQIPVVPAAHYTCGGVVTDSEGRTDVRGLYAAGETAHTGLHGANRLASNSLLECVVMGRGVARAIAETAAYSGQSGDKPVVDTQRVRSSPGDLFDAAQIDAAQIDAWRRQIQEWMSRDVGIIRTDAGLARAAEALRALQLTLRPHRAELLRSSAGIDLCNLCDIAALIVRAAVSRQESRGAHYNADWPHTWPKGLATVLTPDRPD